MQQTAAGALGTNYSKGKIFCSFYTKGEEIFNAVSHIAGAAFGLIAWALTLFFAYPDPAAMAAVSVFGASIVILYTMSALYHFLPDGRAKGIFRIFDHCTIYLLIAGTYTPYCVIALGGTAVGFWVLLVEWLCAAVGIAMNAAAMNNKVVKGISMALYFTMGWLAIFVFPPLISAISPPLAVAAPRRRHRLHGRHRVLCARPEGQMVPLGVAHLRSCGHRAAICKHPPAAALKQAVFSVSGGPRASFFCGRQANAPRLLVNLRAL